MNRGHEVGCAALRGGVPCTCWLKPLQPSIAKLQLAHIREEYIIALENVIALTGEASPQD